MNILKFAWYGSIVMSILFCIAGLSLILFSPASQLMVCYIAACMLIAYGTFKIIGFYSQDLYSLAFEYDLAFGILLIVLAVIILTHIHKILPISYFIFGILVLIDSLLRIQMSIDAKKFGLSIWSTIISIAILTGFFSVVLMITSFGDNHQYIATGGLTILFEGFMNLYVILKTVKVKDIHIP